MTSFTFLSMWGVLLLEVLFLSSNSSSAPIIEKQITVNIPESIASKNLNNRLMTIKWDVSAGDRVEVDGRKVLHRQLAEGQNWTLPCPDGDKFNCKQVSFELKPNFVAKEVVVKVDTLKKDHKMEAFEKEVLDWKV